MKELTVKQVLELIKAASNLFKHGLSHITKESLSIRQLQAHACWYMRDLAILDLVYNTYISDN